MSVLSIVADMQRISIEITQAIRNDHPVPALKSEALRTLVTALVFQRGDISD